MANAKARSTSERLAATKLNMVAEEVLAVVQPMAVPPGKPPSGLLGAERRKKVRKTHSPMTTANIRRHLAANVSKAIRNSLTFSDRRPWAMAGEKAMKFFALLPAIL